MTEGSLEANYGKEPYTYYGSSFLNRLSFLREDYGFLHAAINHPSTQFLVLDRLAPYVDTLPKTKAGNTEFKNLTFTPRPARHALRFVTRGSADSEIAQLVGQPFEASQEEQIKNWSAERDAVGINRPLVVFLGLDQSTSSANVLQFARGKSTYTGQAYFAVDVTSKWLKTEDLQQKAQALLKSSHFQGASLQPNPMAVRLSHGEAGVYAQARTYVDWNTRNQFCAGCGLRNMSANGGCKLVCPPTNKGQPQTVPCETRGALSNLSFPRTDVSIIVAVINHAGDKLLLGRGPKWPKRFYSCLAGFLEPGETLEECVRREVWEEAGLDIGRVIVHASQPWPYPANIMVGCIAQVKEHKDAGTVHLGHDPELEDAQWYSFDDISTSLALAANDYKGMEKQSVPLVPQPEALAWTLLESVVNGRINGFKSKL